MEELLRKLEEQLLQPDTRQNPDELLALLADDFQEFGSSGRIWTKADITGGIQAREMTLTDFAVRPLAADVMLTTFRVHDRTRQQETLRSSIWKQQHGRWQMVFHQGTPAAEKK